MTSCASPSNRRAEARSRVLLSGKLTYGDGFTLDCSIREQSETGARIVVGAALLPRHVVFVSVTKAMAYEAEVVWRRGAEAGLRFKASHPMDTAPEQAPRPLRLARKLWAESMAR